MENSKLSVRVTRQVSISYDASDWGLYTGVGYRPEAAMFLNAYVISAVAQNSNAKDAFGHLMMVLEGDSFMVRHGATDTAVREVIVSVILQVYTE